MAGESLMASPGIPAGCARHRLVRRTIPVRRTIAVRCTREQTVKQGRPGHGGRGGRGASVGEDEEADRPFLPTRLFYGGTAFGPRGWHERFHERQDAERASK